MPRRLSRTKRLLMTTGAVLATAGALPGVAAAAECEVVPTTTAFAQFGDTNNYFLAPGGAFDTMWAEKRGRPKLVANLNPFNVGGGITSLQLDRDESVTSEPFCVDRTMPHLRFLARRHDGGELQVTLRMYDSGRLVDTWDDNLTPAEHGSWALSRTIGLRTGSLAAGESRTVTLQIGGGGGSNWVVDDVFIDPYRR